MSVCLPVSPVHVNVMPAHVSSFPSWVSAQREAGALCASVGPGASPGREGRHQVPGLGTQAGLSSPT